MMEFVVLIEKSDNDYAAHLPNLPGYAAPASEYEDEDTGWSR